jgi:DNA helicase HerA-like ATPase
VVNGLGSAGREDGAQGVSLGVVVGGSLTQGVEVRLDSGASVEDLKVGTFVTIQGTRHRFMGVVTDIALGSADPRIKHTPELAADSFIAQVVSGTVAYGTITVSPHVTLPAALGDDQTPAAAKTIPAHFSRAYSASQRDVEVVFGQEDERHFWIGNPLDMETKVCLDVDELVKRSIGVFGKTGTGKTFLTRLLLVGILQRDRASSLIFDMHSEYGWSGQDSDRGHVVKGLKQLFPAQVSTFTLDEASSRRRGSQVDEVLRIGYQEVEPEDVALLREALDLSDVAASAAFNLERKFGQSRWLLQFLELEGRAAVHALADDIQVNAQALLALHNRLSRLKRYGFLVENADHDAATRIIEHVTEKQRHVVLEFGRYGNDPTAYVLVSNLLSRRIHDRYVVLKEESEGSGGREPRHLVLVIEEAHKFLSPAIASQTTFGTIARELRKYNVTLMVIDQRPSGIDPEVLSQLGTRLTCQLENERDIEAVLAGAPGGRQLRSVLSRLESRQQALLFGHALPMPVVVRTREYGSAESYTQLGRRPGIGSRRSDTETAEARLEREIKELF